MCVVSIISSNSLRIFQKMSDYCIKFYPERLIFSQCWASFPELSTHLKKFNTYATKWKSTLRAAFLNSLHLTSKVFLSRLLWLLWSYSCSDLAHWADMEVSAVRGLPPTEVYLSYWPRHPLVPHSSRCALTFLLLLTHWNTNAFIVNWRWKMIYEIIFLDFCTL